MRWLNRTYAFLGSPSRDSHRIRLGSLRHSVALYYGVLFFVSAYSFVPLALSNRLSEGQWLWPVAWLSFVPVGAGIGALLFWHLVSTAFLAWNPWHWTARFSAALSLFFLAAARSSFGVIEHDLHGWVLSSWALIPLVENNIRLSDRRNNILFFWAAQSVFLLTYFLSGLWKLRFTVEALFSGTSVVDLLRDSLNFQIAQRSLEVGHLNFAGSILLNHPWLGAPLWLAGLYIELACLFVIFRPRLLRPFAISLLLMHIGVRLIMGVVFWPAVLLAMVLLYHSPFGRSSLQCSIKDFPLIGWFFRKKSLNPHTKGSL